MTAASWTSNEPFNVLAGGIFNLSSTPFEGLITASLFNQNDQIKQDVTEAELTDKIEYSYGTIAEFNCKITKTIEAGDYISLRYKGNNSNEWKVMYGGKMLYVS